MPRRKQVLIYRHVPREHIGTLAAALRKMGVGFRTIDTPRGIRAFPPPSSVSALIVMGGPMGVYEQDRYPFLTKENAHIRRFIKEGTPVIGICLGSQLIAAALGARVYPNAVKEIGWHPLTLTKAGRRDPLFTGFRKQETVFHWHGDTFDLPKGALLLATSKRCRHQAFRWGRNVYGLQFHIEVTAAMVNEWLRQPGAAAEVRAAGPKALSLLRNKMPGRAAVLKRLATITIDNIHRFLL